MVIVGPVFSVAAGATRNPDGTAVVVMSGAPGVNCKLGLAGDAAGAAAFTAPEVAGSSSVKTSGFSLGAETVGPAGCGGEGVLGESAAMSERAAPRMTHSVCETSFIGRRVQGNGTTGLQG